MRLFACTCLHTLMCMQGAESFLEEPEGYVLTGLWDGRIVRLISDSLLQTVASTGLCYVPVVFVWLHHRISQGLGAPCECREGPSACTLCCLCASASDPIRTLVLLPLWGCMQG